MAADNPYAELNEARDQARHHAERARKWADAADLEATRAAEPLSHDNVGAGRLARRFAEVSTAHGLAALATAAGGGGILSIEDLGR